jgi:hypothetical protein
MDRLSPNQESRLTSGCRNPVELDITEKLRMVPASLIWEWESQDQQASGSVPVGYTCKLAAEEILRLRALKNPPYRADMEEQLQRLRDHAQLAIQCMNPYEQGQFRKAVSDYEEQRAKGKQASPDVKVNGPEAPKPARVCRTCGKPGFALVEGQCCDCTGATEWANRKGGQP